MAMWVAVASAVMQGISAISKGNQAAKQAKAQAQVNEYNAAVATQRADSTRSVYAAREDQTRRRQRLILGRQRAMSAESGTGLGGSNADVERQSEVAAELDALNIRYEGDLEAKGLLSQAELERNSASQSRSNASSYRTAGWLGAGAAALSGYGNYLKYSTPVSAAEKSSDRLIMDYNGMYPYG